jgi:hypothetical protein
MQDQENEIPQQIHAKYGSSIHYLLSTLKDLQLSNLLEQGRASTHREHAVPQK